MSRVKTQTATSQLRNKLAQAQRQQIFNRFAIGFGALFVFLVLALFTVATSDWIFEWPTSLRAVAFLITILGAALGLRFSYKRWIKPYSISDAAVDTENQLAQFGQRLRTTIDYEQGTSAPAKASESLLESLRSDSLTLAQKVNWEAAIDRKPLELIMIAATSLFLLLAMVFALFAEFRIAVARSLLLPFEYTTATYSPESATIRLGESVQINAVISGRPVESANIRYRQVGSESDWVVTDLLPLQKTTPIENEPSSSGSKEEKSRPESKIVGEVSAILSDLKSNTEFEVLIGSRKLPLGLVTVLQPLTLDQVRTTIVAPEYTKLNPWNADSLELSVPEGSSLELELTFNRDVSDIQLVPQAKSRDPDVERAPSSPQRTDSNNLPQMRFVGNQAKGVIEDVRKSMLLAIEARAADGIILEDKQFNIRVKPDLKPRVRFLEPKEDLTVSATDAVPMVIEAEDDYGLHQLGILFQIGTEPMQTLITQDAVGSAEPKRIATVLSLEKFALSASKAVTYYAFAEDEYFGTRRRTLTPLRFIDIYPEGSYAQSQQSDESSSGDGPISDLAQDIEDLVKRQRQELSQAFLQEQKSEATEEIVGELAQSQQEVLDETNELGNELERLGAKEPALDEAGQNMENAVEKFDDSDLTSAVPSQQEALSNLIRAREEIRKKLKEANGTSKSQTGSTERKSPDKPRPPKKETADKQEKIAQARKQIDELAKREREWSKQVQDFQPKTPPADEPQQDSSNSDSKKQAASAPEINATQKQIQSELNDVKQDLERMKCDGGGVSQRLDQASENMQMGSERFNSNNFSEASKSGELAADQLENLSSHLGAMNSRDFGERLEQAQKTAEQISQKQKGIAKSIDSSEGSRSAKEQEELATEAEMLADLLKTLKKDAGRESGEVQQRLDQAYAETPPKEIASGMTDTAESMRLGRNATAKQQANEVLDQLQRLAKSIESTRKQYSQPQLREMMDLEEQLAMLEEEVKQNESPKQGAGDLQERSKKLESRLKRLASRDKKLAKALQEGSPAPNQASDTGPQIDAKDSLGWNLFGEYPRIRRATQALQTRIQEEILESSIMDADPNVPSAYKEMVEKYFKALSDDLR